MNVWVLSEADADQYCGDHIISIHATEASAKAEYDRLKLADRSRDLNEPEEYEVKV